VATSICRGNVPDDDPSRASDQGLPNAFFTHESVEHDEEADDGNSNGPKPDEAAEIGNQGNAAAAQEHQSAAYDLSPLESPTRPAVFLAHGCALLDVWRRIWTPFVRTVRR